MRTYQLQNDGLDTFDANTTLGFDDDERDYGNVARMLRMLNCTRTVLLSRVPPTSPHRRQSLTMSLIKKVRTSTARSEAFAEAAKRFT
jgi:GTP cyclohydrolase II